MPALKPIFMPHDQRRELIRESTLQGVKDLFPIIGDHRELHLENASIEKKSYDPREHKQALLKGGTIQEPVRGNLVIRDKEGKVLNSKDNHTLMRVPMFTGLNSFVVDGNEYIFKNQLRTLPGVYTRKRENDTLEASFNLAKGANFRVSMDPESGHMHMEYGSSKVPMYPILREFGLSHDDISKYWGKELANRNSDKYGNSRKAAIGKVYAKLIPASKQQEGLTPQEKAAAVLESFDKTQIDVNTTAKTLGKSFDKVNPESLLYASRKLLRVYNGEDQEDDRDSLEFQKILSPEDFFRERLAIQGRQLKYKLKSKLDLSPDPKVSKILPSSSLSPVIKNFITGSRLSTLPSQINPVEILDAASSVTRVGEGGIESEQAIPSKLRNLHPSQLGIIDPFRTPESHMAGVDVRATTSAYKDENGQMFTVLKNVRTGKRELVPAALSLKSTVAFPMQEVHKGNVDVMQRGKVRKVKPKDVDYQIVSPAAMYGISTNLVPLLESSQGNRILMGSKMVGQALPLVNREVPLVQVGMDGTGVGDEVRSVEEHVAQLFLPRLDKTRGTQTVKEVSEDSLVFTDKKGKDTVMPLFKRHPLASKTYLSNYSKVKVGDKVKAGAVLADSNYTKDSTLALGKNLKVAYMAYHGLNSNDAVVISSGAAKKMKSLHMVKKTIDLDDTTDTDHRKHAANFPRVFSKDQYEKLKDGIIRPGTRIRKGDPIASVVRKVPPSVENQMFGRIHKSLARSYMDNSLTWDKDHEGEVVDVVRHGKRLTVTVKYKEPVGIGDKLSNRYGGKGVVSKIVDDESMVKDEAGKPIDLLWTSLGVVSRINPAQVLETGLAKVAEKTGKPYKVKNFEKVNNVKWVKKELKKHGVKDKETVFDPITGKKIPNIMVGPQYTFKLFKSSETNFSARGINSGYDLNQQPARGGKEGAKGTGIMEINALLAHNARDLIKENAIIKGTRNADYWRAVQLGLPLPAPKETFAFNKFEAMLKGSGIKLGREGNLMTLAPLHDKEVLKASGGEIRNGKMVIAKNLRPETGGLFDPGVTGGLSGQRWSHIDLGESFVNPMFEDPARRLLGLSAKDMRAKVSTKGGDYVRKKLNSIDVLSRKKELSRDIRRLKGSAKDNALKQLKALRALKKFDMKAGDAYMMQHVPVLPPQYRPVSPSFKGDLLISDINHLYKDALLARDKLKEAKGLGLPDEDVADIRSHVQESLGAVIGTNDPVSSKAASGAKKGLVKTIVGTKEGFYNGKLIANRQDLTGRGTAAPDPSLGMDEVGLPEEMMWSMYHPFLVKNLVGKGYPALRAREEVEGRTMTARQELLRESNTRPVILNRAPSLHRFNMLSAYPTPIMGKTIRVSPFIEEGMNLDYDGDAMQVYLPASQGALADAKKMTTSNNLFSDTGRDSLLALPKHEALAGLVKGGLAKSKGSTTKFETGRKALEAYRRGEIGLNSNIEVAKDD
jgi:DNA-directed RNA polymerase beta subunit